MATKRIKAIKWWEQLPTEKKVLLAQKYKSELFNRDYSALTGREIEMIIWTNEVGLKKIKNKIKKIFS